MKEVSAHFGADINRFKIGYDCVSCLAGVAMSFFAFGLWHFEGVKRGMILCALINGYVIGRFSAFYEKHWTFCAASRGGNTSRRTLRREVKRLVSPCAGAQIKKLPCLCAGQLEYS